MKIVIKERTFHGKKKFNMASVMDELREEGLITDSELGEGIRMLAQTDEGEQAVEIYFENEEALVQMLVALEQRHK